MPEQKPGQKKYALVSLYDKSGLIAFVWELIGIGWTIISSGGTAKVLREAGVPVMDIAELLTGSLRKRLVDHGVHELMAPEKFEALLADIGGPILGHRVVTLSREKSATLLSRDIPEDFAELERLGIPYIGMVVVDVYPLEAALADPTKSDEEKNEMVDIGGPTMLSEAAKGGRLAVCDKADWPEVLNYLRSGFPLNGGAYPRLLAGKADGFVANYRLASARWRSHGKIDGVIGTQHAECKYGENAYQAPAALFSTGSKDPFALDRMKVVEGDTPSFNNWGDIHALVLAVTHSVAALAVLGYKPERLAVATKHTIPCGAAWGADFLEVCRRTVDGDRLAVHGGLVLCTDEVDEAAGEVLLHYGMEGDERRLMDGIVAPSFTPEAIALLRRDKTNKCRFIQHPLLGELTPDHIDSANQFRFLRGTFLRQPAPMCFPDLFNDPELKRFGPELTRETVFDLGGGFALSRGSKSNTIVCMRGGRLLGLGAAQQDRVGGVFVATWRANRSGRLVDEAFSLEGASLVSDSFFPFPDGPETAVVAGVRAMFTTYSTKRHLGILEEVAKKGVSILALPDSKYRTFYH